MSIRFGIIGPGGIADKFARDILLTPNAELVSVASRDLEKAVQFKIKHNAKYAYGSYKEMLQSKTIDAVYIATPHNFHHEQALMCIDHGYHVLIEKPITVNQKELIQIINRAKQNNVLVMEAMWSRFLPITKKLKQIIDSGEIGDLVSVDAPLCYHLIGDYPKEGRLLNPNLAGGALLDLGVYPMAFLNYICDFEVEKVDSKMKFSDQKVDLSTEATITYVNGVKATFEAAIDKTLPHDANIVGSKYNIFVPNYSRGEVIEISNGTKYTLPFRGEGFVDQIEHFSATILKGKINNSMMPLEDSYKIISLMDKIRKQHGFIYPFEEQI